MIHGTQGRFLNPENVAYPAVFFPSSECDCACDSCVWYYRVLMTLFVVSESRAQRILWSLNYLVCNQSLLQLRNSKTDLSYIKALRQSLHFLWPVSNWWNISFEVSRQPFLWWYAWGYNNRIKAMNFTSHWRQTENLFLSTLVRVWEGGPWPKKCIPTCGPKRAGVSD